MVHGDGTGCGVVVYSIISYVAQACLWLVPTRILRLAWLTFLCGELKFVTLEKVLLKGVADRWITYSVVIQASNTRGVLQPGSVLKFR